MKRILLLSGAVLIAIMFLGACGKDSQNPVPAKTQNIDDPSVYSEPEQLERSGPILNTGGPRIQFENDYVSLGKATPEEVISHSFVFRNTGNAPLLITEVKKKTLEGC